MAHELTRGLRYAVHDWTRDMPRATRMVALAGMLLQGYAIWAGISRSLVWPVIWPTAVPLFLIVVVVYLVGYFLQNAALASEFVRKTQLESEQTAAAQIQRTLQPERIASPPGFRIETFYKPFRVVGGDYFDVIDLPDGRTLLAIADVSGKGMPASLLAANIQALVRTLSASSADPASLAEQINRHLCRHTPDNRFATAVFVLLDHASGDLTYANAGHNPPILRRPESIAILEPTGIALGWFEAATYEARTVSMTPGSSLLLFTDGLSDSIADPDPQRRLQDTLVEDVAASMATIHGLVDARLNEDDVTVMLVRRNGEAQAREDGDDHT